MLGIVCATSVDSNTDVTDFFGLLELRDALACIVYRATVALC